MREIKFRGKDIAGVWRFGDFIHYRSCVAISETKHGICGNYEVVLETVGEFTNDYDCDGNEVYEGDILEYRDEEDYIIAQVVWDDSEHWGFLLQIINSTDDFELEDFTLDEFKIIGNVHDNPELLKVDNNTENDIAESPMPNKWSCSGLFHGTKGEIAARGGDDEKN